jgi:glycine cleavage system aminomethyltransferase T/glycine/D-amino acid oxidase-like deaminating enzyme
MPGARRLPDHVGTLVIGAGIVGCSTAYHLAKRGDDDVAVVDKGPIPKTGGSTVHAPAGLTQTSPNQALSNLAQKTRELYDSVGGWEENGAIEIATTDECWDSLKRRMDQARTNGVEGAELLTPDQVNEHVPIIDTDDVLGGFYVSTDGRIDTVTVLEELKAGAEERGVPFYERATVTDIETADGAVDTVVTDRGEVAVDDVLVAGNIWSPLIGEMVDVDIPLLPCAHQYAVTEPIAELSGWDHDVGHPWVRHWDGDLYFRQHGDGYGIGNYNHDPIVVDPADIHSHDEAIETEPVYDFVPGRGSRHEPFKQPSSRAFTEEHFEDAWAEAKRLFPSFEGKEIRKAFNGMFSFTPDHMPIIGEAPRVDGFWVAAAIWLSHGGAAGKLMADLLEDGTTTVNLNPLHITRFEPHATSPSFVHDRASEVYDTVYDIHHPRGSFRTHRGLRHSPVYPYQEDLDAEFYEEAGWERARWYGANESLLDEYEVPDRSGWEANHWSPIEGAEHRAVRDGVGIADRTGTTTVTVSGDSARQFVKRAFGGESTPPVGTVEDTPVRNKRGGNVGDATVARLGEDRFYVSLRGGRGSRRVSRLRALAASDPSVTVAKENRCVISVHGPDARAVLDPVMHTAVGADSFPPYTAEQTHVKSAPVIAMRVSNTGEDGWELHAPMEYGAALWLTLREAGEKRGAVPVGDGALETLRLEAGQRECGTDLHAEFATFRGSLDRAPSVDAAGSDREHPFDGGDDPAVDVAYLTLDDPRTVVMHGIPVYDDETRVGHVAHAGYGYTVDACVLYGYLLSEYADPGTRLSVEYETERYPATVRNEPLGNASR